ncbi:MAG: AraC family transcriptional regulator ligand-binding domain-containing protein [Comamonadaceae bacterium]|nr:AraC family transcriptional regulator ligand-binding domain-containing protein [Comamonadaceae bacterium]
MFEDPGQSVAYRTLCGVLAACGRARRLPASRLAGRARRRPFVTGALGYLILNAPDVRSALDTLIQHMDVHDRGAAPRLELSSHVVMLRYDILLSNVDGSAPVSDAALAIGRNIMLSLCGPTWKPLEVHLRHAAPDDVSPYRRFFQAPVVFNAERTALVFGSPWLSAPVPGADSALRRHFQGVSSTPCPPGRSAASRAGFARRFSASSRRTAAPWTHWPGGFHAPARGLPRRLRQAGTSFARSRPRRATPGARTVAWHHQRYGHHRQLGGLHQCQRLRARVCRPRGPAASRMAQDRRGPVSRSRGRRIGREPLSVEALRFSQAVSARPVELSAPQGAPGPGLASDDCPVRARARAAAAAAAPGIPAPASSARRWTMRSPAARHWPS